MSLEPAEASLVFQVISQQYERKGAVVLTSSKAFSAWGEVFAGDAVMASAALDRLLHRCTAVNIRGESYRLKEKLKAGENGCAASAAHTSSRPHNAPGRGGSENSAAEWQREFCGLK